MVKIIADSISELTNIRVTSFLVEVPTIKLAEIRTHRKISQLSSEILLCTDQNDDKISMNANSSRAISLKKYEKYRYNFYLPTWTKDQKGMVGDELYNLDEILELDKYWILWKDISFMFFDIFRNKKIHKQNTSLFLNGFSHTELILTADEYGWENFFRLRTSKETYPDIREIAIKMEKCYIKNTPKKLNSGDWHIVFEDYIDEKYKCGLKEKLLISASMCARISYDNKSEEKFEEHIRRAIKCLNNRHLSIFEHQLKSPTEEDLKLMELRYYNGKPSFGNYFSNILGFVQLRKLIECNHIDLTNLFGVL